MTPLAITLLSIAMASLGVAGGALGHQALGRRTEQQAVSVAIDDTAHVHAEATRELSSLDLVQPLCAPAWLAEDDAHGARSLLCREALCWAHTHGTTGGTTDSQCDAISNLANSRYIMAACDGLDSPQWQACMMVFGQRK